MAAAMLAAPAGLAVDTSDWLCESCPFVTGADGDVAAGVTHVSDDAARFGNASGYDESGVYANVDGQGRYGGERVWLRWSVSDLGLDSRAAALEGVFAGGLNLALDYRELPYRLFDTTATVFTHSGGGLVLPADWQPAAVTVGFGMLSTALKRVDIGHDRRTLGLGGRLRVSPRFSLRAEARRREVEGNSVFGGANFTQASLLPRPFDYSTDEIDVGATWAGRRGHLSVGWLGSRFNDRDTGLTWDNPFTSLPGAQSAQLAQPPDNSASQLSLSGRLRFDTNDTVLRASAAYGRLEQDDALLAYTVNPLVGAAALPRRSLDGRVDTSAFTVSMSTRPTARSRLRAGWRSDERDNRTPREMWERVIVDAFASGDAELNTPYGFRRERLHVTGDLDVLDRLRLSAGATRKSIRRDFQEVASQTEREGWGALRWRPGDGIDVAVRAGAEKRDIDRYDQSAALALGQNPLLRKYNLAYRYREFARLRASATLPDKPVTLGLTVRHADDRYTQSVLGLLRGRDRAVVGDIDLALGAASLSATLGWHGIESEQAGSEGFAAVDWRAASDDDFLSGGLGLRMAELTEHTDLEIDWLRTQGESDIAVTSGAGVSSFPTLESNRDSVRLVLRRRGLGALEGSLTLRYDAFDTNDWALRGVGPATIPEVLTLGAGPYDYDVLAISVGFTYRLGADADAGR